MNDRPSHEALSARRRRIEKGVTQEERAKKRTAGLQGMMELPLLEAIDGLLKTGPTHTNVMDLRVGVFCPS